MSLNAKAVVKLLRPKHYVKNLLVALPAFFSVSITSPDVAFKLVCAFLAFCSAASFCYVINDMCDVEKDREHPTKKTRPIAAGEVSASQAKMILFALVALMVAFSIVSGSMLGASVLAIYIALNIAYSAKLKDVALADVAILAAGYVLRVFYGAIVCEIEVSGWLYLTVLAASFFMALGKRSGEIKHSSDEAATTRTVLGEYNVGFLEKNMYMFLGMANIFYALWAKDAGSYMLITVPIVMIMSLRYSMVIHDSSSDGDPIDVICGDKAMTVLVFALVAVMACLLYAF